MVTAPHFRRVSPGVAFQSFVESYYIYEIPGVRGCLNLPAWPRTFLIFDYGDEFVFDYENGHGLLSKPASFVGFMTDKYVCRPRADRGDFKFVAVQFRPLIMKRILGESLACFTDDNIAPEEFFRRDRSDLVVEALAESKTDEEKIRVV